MESRACLYLTLKFIIVLIAILWFESHMLIIKDKCKDFMRMQWKVDNKSFDIQDSLDKRDNFLEHMTKKIN